MYIIHLFLQSVKCFYVQYNYANFRTSYNSRAQKSEIRM